MTDRPHGYARYRLDGCRCYTCGWARAEYDDHRNRQIAYGRWQPFTDLELVTEHLAVLNAIGFGDRAVAALAGLSRKTIRDIRAGVRHDPGRGNPQLGKIRTATAAAILAVPIDTDQASDGASISASRTWDRIHALIAAGYPRTWIAQQAGLGRSLQLRHDRITAGNARKIETLYRRVGDTPGHSQRARNEGRRNGWLTPFERAADGWDDDSPAPEATPHRRPWQARL